jgi:pyruvate formate lyase activating enzyme
MLDIAKLAKENRLKTVMVTNGYINKEPLIELIKYIDAFSVDLKSYSNDFFIKLTSSTMQPVLESIELINEYKKHLEIDYLVITNENDNEIEFEKLVKYISKKLNKEIVLHINRYYPNYLLKNLMTPEKTMISLYNIAKQYLDYVYIGNINLDIGKNTYCNRCKTLLIERNYYNIDIKNLNKNGECENCGNKVIEVGNND